MNSTDREIIEYVREFSDYPEDLVRLIEGPAARIGFLRAAREQKKRDFILDGQARRYGYGAPRPAPGETDGEGNLLVDCCPDHEVPHEKEDRLVSTERLRVRVCPSCKQKRKEREKEEREAEIGFLNLEAARAQAELAKLQLARERARSAPTTDSDNG